MGCLVVESDEWNDGFDGGSCRYLWTTQTRTSSAKIELVSFRLHGLSIGDCWVQKQCPVSVQLWWLRSDEVGIGKFSAGCDCCTSEKLVAPSLVM